MREVAGGRGRVFYPVSSLSALALQAVMKILHRTEYACIAMLELASSYGSGRPVPIRAIATRHGIPDRFLVQILLQLKAAGLVTSTRGAAGGYHLIRPPKDVSLGEVMDVIGGSSSISSGAGPNPSILLSPPH